MNKATQIKNDANQALKNGEKEKLTALRMLIAALEIEKVKNKVEIVEKLSDEVVNTVTQKQIKLLDQEIESQVKAGRDTTKVEGQKKVISVYLPEQLSDDQLIGIIKEKIVQLNINDVKQKGKLMGVLSQELKGKADLGQVSKLLIDLLS